MSKQLPHSLDHQQYKIPKGGLFGQVAENL